jgi:hypothetical protein
MEAKIDELSTLDRQVILTLSEDEMICNDCIWIGAFKPEGSDDYQSID